MSRPTTERESWVKSRLRENGRVTVARLATLRTLDGTDEHLSASEVHQLMLTQIPDVNLSTVYRTLARLELLGLIHRLDANGEARFGSAQYPHHHAMCTRCGRVWELDAHVAAEMLARVEPVLALRVDHSSGLTVRGICSNGCKSETNPLEPTRAVRLPATPP